jgi:CheY-like chemotaxis protein
MHDLAEIGKRHKEPIDLLSTDVVLPRMSGRKLAEYLALLRAGTNVLYVSGYTDHAIVQRGVLEANTALLQKLFTPAALGRKVLEVLDADRQKSS